LCRTVSVPVPPRSHVTLSSSTAFMIVIPPPVQALPPASANKRRSLGACLRGWPGSSAALPGCNSGCLRRVCCRGARLTGCKICSLSWLWGYVIFLSFSVARSRATIEWPVGASRWMKSPPAGHHGRSSFLPSFFLLRPSLGGVAAVLRSCCGSQFALARWRRRSPTERRPARPTVETRARAPTVDGAFPPT
jgi:hypothetical protein